MALARRRAEQGFSAIQLVVGIPPEVGPENENTKSEAGFPWTLRGDFNQAYLELARERIRQLNELGLRAIVYGAWGHQIHWLGLEGMTRWWFKLIETLDGLDVIYCLSGESSLWVNQESMLLPDRSTDDLAARTTIRWRQFVPARLRPLARRFVAVANGRRSAPLLEERRQAWSLVLDRVAQKTGRPILIHPVPAETGFEAVCNPHLLAANTVQTGHDPLSRNQLWQRPLALLRGSVGGQRYINLEPWYEGIRDQFWCPDQLYAYWVTMLAGASSYCYGAHGIWNVGDGKFLAHWGRQTFAQAMALETPTLLGLSHRQFMQRGHQQGETFLEMAGEELLTIGRRTGRKVTQYFPEISRVDHIPGGRIWLPLQGAFSESLPATGQVVVFTA